MQMPFEIEIDASGHFMGALLLRGSNPVCRRSKLFSGFLLKYHTYDKELYASVLAVKKWRHYSLPKKKERKKWGHHIMV